MSFQAGMGFEDPEQLRLLAALLLPRGTSSDLSSGMASVGPALAGGLGAPTFHQVGLCWWLQSWACKSLYFSL